MVCWISKCFVVSFGVYLVVYIDVVLKLWSESWKYLSSCSCMSDEFMMWKMIFVIVIGLWLNIKENWR